MKYIQIQTTADTRQLAEKIAGNLIDGRYAACVQIMDKVESCYQWEGKVEKAKEFLLLIKTTEEKYPEVEKVIKKLHTYKTPEIIATTFNFGSAQYFDWIEESVK